MMWFPQAAAQKGWPHRWELSGMGGMHKEMSSVIAMHIPELRKHSHTLTGCSSVSVTLSPTPKHQNITQHH